MNTFLFVCLSVTFGAAQAQTYAYFTFDPPGSTSTQVNGMNGAGVIVGSYKDAAGTHNFIRGADGLAYQTIEVPGAAGGSTTVDAINNPGQVAGTFRDAASGLVRCYVRSADGLTFTPFDIPGFVPGNAGPKAINDSGEITGWKFEISASAAESFVRNPDGTIIDIAAYRGQDGSRSMGINKAGEVVGYYRAGGSGGLDHGFRRSPGGIYTTFDLPGTDSWTRILSINNRGQVTATWRSSYGFASNPDGSFSEIRPLGSQLTYPAAINDSGVVAGWYGDGVTNHGFLAVPSGDQGPVIRSTPSGVVTAVAFGGTSTFDSKPLIAPGGWIEIYGQNLSSTTRSWAASDFTGNSAPASLDGVSVRIGGRPAFLSYVSPGQVNALVPDGISPGDALLMLTNGTQRATFTVTVQDPQPSLLVLPRTESQEGQYLGAVFPDFATFVLPPGYATNVSSRPAKAGDTIVLFGVALGAVSPQVPAGQIAGVAKLQQAPQVFFNGTPALVTYAGTAPGTVGLYQINVVVPDVALPAGRTFDDVAIQVQIGGSAVPPSRAPQIFTGMLLPIEVP